MLDQYDLGLNFNIWMFCTPLLLEETQSSNLNEAFFSQLATRIINYHSSSLFKETMEFKICEWRLKVTKDAFLGQRKYKLSWNNKICEKSPTDPNGSYLAIFVTERWNSDLVGESGPLGIPGNHINLFCY